MRRAVMLVIAAMSLAACSVAADEPKPEELAWLRETAVVFETAEPRRELDDLKPFAALVGDARIVALGEGTHGTREFFQMKHRLTEFLARELGFTIFAIEANMPEAYRVNDFVLTGRGDPKELLNGMYFWTWNTSEVLDLILWMREFNASGQGRMEFTGFDMQTPDVAMEIVREFVQRVDPAYLPDVAATYELAARAKRAGAGGAFGVATGRFPVGTARGKRIRYGGWIKTEGITRQWAGLWWRVDGESKPLEFDNMHDRGAQGTTPWTRYQIELSVSPDAQGIAFGALHGGDGTAWFDDLQVEIDGQPFVDDELFDFGFETGEARGMHTGGSGYDVAIDDGAAHSGQRSLRMKYVGAENPATAPKAAAEKCAAVWKDLKAARDDYAAKSSPQETDWAIQNARVVLQCLQMVAGKAGRDQSMAENVQWILEHADPGAKIVLWAHNGHVRRDRHIFGERTMGACLSRKYGKEMVVVGFACNTGQYTAVAPGRGLQSNDLQPAEPGSAEFYFHGSGLPRFMLDVRKASRDNAASSWLTRSIEFRSIGALAMEQQFSTHKLPDAYDILVYFDVASPTRLLNRN